MVMGCLVVSAISYPIHLHSVCERILLAAHRPQSAWKKRRESKTETVILAHDDHYQIAL
jgi:hypothetical protein